MAEIYLAGGCFWGLERYLSAIPGVQETEVGYANGRGGRPSYEQVCRQNTGHAETVRVRYDTNRLSLPFLLSLFFAVIDPTAVNRQGNDRGIQYRSGIYYLDETDRPVIDAAIADLQKTQQKPVAIEVKPLENFGPAEAYHQKYLEKNPGGYCHIGPQHFAAAASALVDPAAYQAPEPDALREALSAEAFQITQKGATEPPFRNAYWDHFQPGIYVDITSGEPLFGGGAKFDAGCGWPSFSRPIDPNTLRETRDLSHGLVRTEVKSRVGNAHLGHVFPDGPKENGGLRYCINSAALRFIPKSEMEKEGYGHLLAWADEEGGRKPT